jgi:NSS family neurotransmitter:Na+ symporter
MGEEESSDQFTRLGFILSAIGSAVGLGNIWRFPYIAYENGGGAFFLPYLFALLTAGIPLLIAEVALGHRFRGVTPLAFARLSRGAEWVGWWQLAISFVISTYYAVIVAWAMAYTVFSVGLRWGGDTEGFLTGSFLNVVDTPGAVGPLEGGVLIPLAIVWVLTLVILFQGVRRGLERANRILLPILLVTFLAVVLRAVTLPGAGGGLNALFQPDLAGLRDSRVWIAAYSQIFFSLSVGFGIMATFGSYLPRRGELANSSAIAAFANSSFEVVAGIGVFAALGFLAAQQGVGVEEVVDNGVGLAFVVFPQILNTFPGGNALFGVLFFAALTIAGLSSLISIVETYVAGAAAKFGWSRRRSLLVCGGLAAAVSLLFATRGGFYLLDVVDTWVNNFGVIPAALVEAVLLAWVFRVLGELEEHVNDTADFGLGRGWKLALTVVTPLVLGFQLVSEFVRTLGEGYGGYAGSVLAVGWAVAAAAVVIGVLLGLWSWRPGALALTNGRRERERG